jgi:hypothetical protein
VLLATVVLLRASHLGAGRSEEDAVIPSIGRRVSRPPRPRLTPVPADPTQGGDA